MQSNIKLFENQEFGKVRVIQKDGQPWWVLSDVCKALGLTNPSKVVQRLDEDERLKVDPNLELGSRSNMPLTLISESGLYAVILRSDKPQARAFRKWITAEVLPAIRQHGAYITPETLERMQVDNAFAAELLHRLSKEHAKVGALMAYVDKLQAKAQYYDAVLQSDRTVPATLIAKDYGMTTIAFNKLLHALGVQYRIGPQWFLYKEHAGKGYTVTKTYYYTYQTKVSTHTEWTMKGRAFIYALLAWYGILPDAERQIGA